MMESSVQSNGTSTAFRVPFGIGCWRFGIRREKPVRLSVSEYVNLLSKELETITSLNNLEISSEEDDFEDFLGGHLDETDFGLAVFPGHTIFEITFELYIPFRVQREIVGRHCDDHTGTEIFRVHNLNGYHETVSFVELIGSPNASDPSTAVRVVRDYLLVQIEKLSGDLVFDFLGPSPFHADFWVEGHDVPSLRRNGFELQRRGDDGYAQIVFKCSIQDFPSLEEACEVLFYMLSDELDKIYMIFRSNSINLARWTEIEFNVEKLFDKTWKYWKLQTLYSSASRGTKLADLHENLLRFEADHIRHQHYQNQVVRELYEKEKVTFLQKFSRGSLMERPTFPVRQMIELVSVAEARRSKAIALAVILIASVIGGAVGSTITLLVDASDATTITRESVDASPSSRQGTP